jgi:hypothetical protein
MASPTKLWRMAASTTRPPVSSICHQAANFLYVAAPLGSQQVRVAATLGLAAASTSWKCKSCCRWARAKAGPAGQSKDV